MSDEIRGNETTRRDLLRAAALAVAAGGLELDAAQHVHAEAEAEKKSGPYKPKVFNASEWKTLSSLVETIIPGALSGGAPEFIDLLSSQNAELAAIFTGGLGWMDAEMKRRYGAAYVASRPEQQTAMLDLLAYKKNHTPEVAGGVTFFDWCRRLAADAYYTSKPGIAELGYKGNVGMAEFKIPQEAYDYALKRS
jgi:gluconate 2-dehydrogenase gamma chain